ncbi:MAG: PQQ-dependent sugar dehydrogenase [Planctomycetes bacterium]|nr:PQQ-dependent sugar dehydrogenase [Planctomycetota bacterium]
MSARALLALAPLLAPQHDAPPATDGYAPAVAEASQEGVEAMARITAPEGFVVELVAAEPHLANPVCFYPADDGSFYVGESFRVNAGVTDMRLHTEHLEEDMACRTVEDRVAMFERWVGDELTAQFGTEHDRIKLLRDTDGDGVVDWSTVYADGFNAPADGIGAGLLEYRGDVYWTCIPDLWRLRDTDGDGKADERTSLSNGYGVRVTLLGHDLHGLRIGPDGKLYFSCGDRGFNVAMPAGLIEHPDTGAVLRCNLDGSELEVVHTGLRNPQELAFDEYGNLFTGDNNSDGGDQARWVQIVEGADSGWRSSYQWIEDPNSRGPWNAEGLWKPHFEGQAAYLLPPIANLGNGPSGLCYYPGTGMPAGYKGYFFLADFRGDAAYSGVHAFTLSKRGASFKLQTPGRLVWSTLVTDVDFGPDGAIYFTDWVHGWGTTGKGRLYRVYDPETLGKGEGAGVARILREGLGSESVMAVFQLLGHADQRVRQEAQFELVRRGPEGHEALKTALARGGSELMRVHGVWGLGMAARADGELLEVLHPYLRDAAPEVRAQVARVLGDQRYAPATENLIKALADAEPRVRLYAAIACARLGDARAVEPLFALAKGAADDDTVLRSAAIYGLERCAGAERLAEATRDANVYARLAAVVALRRQRSDQVARFLFDPDPLVVDEAARAINDVPIDAAYPALADVLPRLDASANRVLVRRVLNANLRLGGLARARKLATFAMDAQQPELARADALRLLAQWAAPSNRDDVISNWRPLEPRSTEGLATLASGLAAYGVLDAPEAVISRWIDVVAAYGARDAAPALAGLVRERARGGALRVRALEALGALGADEYEAALRGALFDPDGTLRAAALEALPTIDAAASMPLFEAVLANGQIAERRAVYAALARIEGFDVDEVFRAEYAKLIAGQLPAELRLDMLEAMYSRPSQNLKLIVEKHRQAREAADPALGAWHDTFFGGDAAAGERLFRAKPELTCLRCHALDAEQGIAVGPDLHGVGKRLTRRQLCEAVVDPNARISPGYESTLLVLDDDSVVAGRILDEDAEWITVLKSDGATEQIGAAYVVERRPDLSAMPNGLTQFLTPREMRDLIAFLAQL